MLTAPKAQPDIFSMVGTIFPILISLTIWVSSRMQSKNGIVNCQEDNSLTAHSQQTHEDNCKSSDLTGQNLLHHFLIWYTRSYHSYWLHRQSNRPLTNRCKNHFTKKWWMQHKTNNLFLTRFLLFSPAGNGGSTFNHMPHNRCNNNNT